MSQELIHVIDQISKEKGISKEMVIEAVESALVSAAKKKYGAQRIAVQIDPKRGDIVMYAYKKVVQDVTNSEEEITLDEAQTLFPEAQMDGEVPLQVEFQGFGRIAAQTARQVIVQKVREAERDVIFKEFNDKIGQLVNGIVLRHEKGAYYIDLGKTEAVLPAREQVPRESYRRGDRVRAYVLEVRDTSKGPRWCSPALIPISSRGCSRWKCPRSTKISSRSKASSARPVTAPRSPFPPRNPRSTPCSRIRHRTCEWEYLGQAHLLEFVLAETQEMADLVEEGFAQFVLERFEVLGDLGDVGVKEEDARLVAGPGLPPRCAAGPGTDPASADRAAG